MARAELPDPATLPLRDIHLPPAVSWWPLAPGWWGLGALLLVALATALLYRYRRRHLAPRRAALAELTIIERAFASDGDGLACAQALSRLVRRLTLLADARATSASGEQADRLLATLGSGPLPAATRAVLLRAPYSPAAAAGLDADSYRAATDALRAWLARLRPPAARART